MSLLDKIKSNKITRSIVLGSSIFLSLGISNCSNPTEPEPPQNIEAKISTYPEGGFLGNRNGLEISFDASGSKYDQNSIDSCTFDFGDGKTYTETPDNAPDGEFDLKTSHVYFQEGTHLIKMRLVSNSVADDDFSQVKVSPRPSSDPNFAHVIEKVDYINLAFSPQFSPDSKELYVMAPGDDARIEVFKMAANGYKPKQITKFYDNVSSYSNFPDGKKIAVTVGGLKSPYGWSTGKMYLVDVETSEIEQIDFGDSTSVSEVDVSPDGKKLAFQFWTYDEKHGLGIKELGKPGYDTLFITDIFQNRCDPDWHPYSNDPEKIIFTAKLEEESFSPLTGYNIYRGSELEKLTDSTVVPFNPSYFPERGGPEAIMFSAYSNLYDDYQHIFGMTLARSPSYFPLVNMTATATTNFAFSPDEKYLAFVHEGNVKIIDYKGWEMAPGQQTED